MNIQVNDKVSAELLCQDHAWELFDLTDSNRSYLREWLPWLDSIATVSDTETFIDSVIREYNTGGGSNFAVLYEGPICGVASLHKIDAQNKIGFIGYWLGKEYVGNGIITEVVKILLELGFVEYQLNKIEIRCAEANSKSRAIPERLGFTQEATLRQCEYLYSRYVDHVVYSLLASEYNA